MPDTRLADISEFQSNIDAPAYLAGGHSCLIVRAHNGYRPDNLWPGRRDYLRAHPFVALGWYQYLASNRDAQQQARDFINTVGPLRPNEFVILDHEEGAGNQISRAEAWFAVVDPWCGFRATLYAGLSFCRDHLGGFDRWKRPRWLAAYQSAEPRDVHELWQHTDNARFPGLAGGVDGNLFHGTPQRFCAVFAQGGTSTAPTPPRPPEALTSAQSSVCVLKRDGGRELFVELDSGQVWHTWDGPGGQWSDWRSLGTPGR
jgi:GH25 family lysozyme M1 (1,4-beta-N-acetylmuramidase)